MSSTPHDPFYSSPFGPFYRRHTPYMVQPEYRIYEMNKRLQSRTEDSDNLWWDAFATEFFEDDATLTLSFCLEDGPKRYTIGRTLIPRYFSTVFEGGVTDLYYILKHSKESYHNSSITVDCDQCAMVTQHGKPMFTKVCTEGRLIVEFTFDDLMRIKTWHFTIRQYRELVPRSILAMHAQDPQVLDQLSKNITRMGLTNFTLNYLRLCVILEPMQELMSRHKTYNLSPRDCLKTCLFQKWQRMVAPPEPTRQPTTKRRKRKNSTSSTSNSSAGNNANSTGSKKKTPAANLSLSSQVPVSLAFLLGLKSCLCLSSTCRGPRESLLELPTRSGQVGGGGGGGQGQGRGGQEWEGGALPWKPSLATWELERNIKSLCCVGT
ncbi:LIM domain-binding protein 2 isoform X1 [Ursus arctos]|uniref:LIM domain-binding protein 2 isoform X1 n=1 Tax=Ursus arctos TaxID=9644 RepID=UPI002549A2B8|nr:LIM domain-binding protein 2 isoform X1 [Ursus arctos]